MLFENNGTEIQNEETYCQNFGESDEQSITENENINSNFLNSPPEIEHKAVVKLKRVFTIKRLIIIILSAIVITSLLCLFFQKRDEENILSITNELAIALNEGDYQKMVSCFEPSAQSAIKSTMDLGSDLFGTDLWNLWSLGSIGLSNSGKNSKIYITVYDLSITSDTTATADISIDYSTKDKDRNSVKYVKINGKWYFSIKNLM